jgi:hypothetical protein
MQATATAAASASSMPASTTTTNDDIRILIDSIQEKDENMQKGVFNIIKKYTSKFTENQNGIFVDMTKLDPSALKEIEELLLSMPSCPVACASEAAAFAALAAAPRDEVNASPSPSYVDHGDDPMALPPSSSVLPDLVEDLTEEERLLCGLDYSSNRKKDLNLFKKKFSA